MYARLYFIPIVLIVTVVILAALTAFWTPHVRQINDEEHSVQASKELRMLRYTVKFYYGVEKEADARALFFEETFKNEGRNPLTLSLWNNFPFVRSVKPEGVFQKDNYPATDGRPPQPKASDLIRLAAGGQATRTRWFGGYASLPFSSQRDENGYHTIYTLTTEARVELTVCRIFGDERENLQKFLTPGEVLATGMICAPPVSFDYKILESEE